MEVEILYPASERDKDCNEQPVTRPKKTNGSARMPTINKKRKMFRGDTNHGRN